MLRTVPVVLVAVAALAAGATATAPSASPPQVAAEIVLVSWATGPAILFESNGVWSIRPNGTGLRRLTAVQGGEPSWSPNGRRIALSWGDTGIAVMNADGVWTIGADGRGLRRVASLRYGIDPAREHDWSQDGNQIVFSQCLRRVPEGQLCHTTRGASAVFTASAERTGPHGASHAATAGAPTGARTVAWPTTASTRSSSREPTARPPASVGGRCTPRAGPRRAGLVPPLRDQRADRACANPVADALVTPGPRSGPVGNALRAQILTVRAAEAVPGG